MTPEKQSLKDKMREKIMLMQSEKIMREVEFVMPEQDRKKFRYACALKKTIFIEIMEKGTPLVRLQELMGCIAITESLIKKHRKTLKQRSQ